MSRTDPVVHIRLPKTALADIDAAAHRDGLHRATWCREVFAAIIQAGISPDRIGRVLTDPDDPPPTPEPRRPDAALGGPHRILTGKCLHPPHLVRHFPTRDVCACGTVVRKDAPR